MKCLKHLTIIILTIGALVAGTYDVDASETYVGKSVSKRLIDTESNERIYFQK
jgi:hypothetical protein